MMRIALIIALAFVLLLAWLGYQIKATHKTLAIACFVSAASLGLIILSGTMGWIGG